MVEVRVQWKCPYCNQWNYAYLDIEDSERQTYKVKCGLPGGYTVSGYCCGGYSMLTIGKITASCERVEPLGE